MREDRANSVRLGELEERGDIALSIGFAAPPRGLRVKNWKTFAPIETAVCAMARYPPDALR
jgi:hypothetical protein